MSDLRERLSRLKRTEPPSGKGNNQEIIADLRAKIDQITKKKPLRTYRRGALYEGPGIETLIPGELVDGEGSSFFVARQEYETDYQHGNIRIEEIHKGSHEIFGEIGNHPELSDFAPEQAVFIDTETTGLSGGTGTYAFMVGVGYFEGQQFIVEQFLMRDQSEEADMLSLLRERLSRFRYFVSFNGKSFDLPLLESRFILARLQPDLLDRPHLDLLHPSRRIWKRSLGSCRLSNLERELLGIERVDDVPGELIPGIYFNYLETKDPTRIERVFYHNKLDILSLVTLTVLVRRRITDHASACSKDGMEQYSLGRIHMDQGRLEDAVACFRSALEACTYSDHEWEVLKLLSMAYKKSDEFSCAVQTWKDMIGIGPERETYPYIELSKYFEHREKDYQRAEEYARKAARINQALHLNGVDDIEHRVRRLQRKQESDEI